MIKPLALGALLLLSASASAAEKKAKKPSMPKDDGAVSAADQEKVALENGLPKKKIEKMDSFCRTHLTDPKCAARRKGVKPKKSLLKPMDGR